MASRKGLTNARILRLGLGVPNATGFDVRVILVPGLFCWEVGIQIRDWGYGEHFKTTLTGSIDMQQTNNMQRANIKGNLRWL